MGREQSIKLKAPQSLNHSGGCFCCRVEKVLLPNGRAGEGSTATFVFFVSTFCVLHLIYIYNLSDNFVQNMQTDLSLWTSYRICKLRTEYALHGIFWIMQTDLSFCRSPSCMLVPTVSRWCCTPIIQFWGIIHPAQGDGLPLDSYLRNEVLAFKSVILRWFSGVNYIAQLEDMSGTLSPNIMVSFTLTTTAARTYIAW